MELKLGILGGELVCNKLVLDWFLLFCCGVVNDCRVMDGWIGRGGLVEGKVDNVGDLGDAGIHFGLVGMCGEGN